MVSDNDVFDYIVVGAGAAGCVVASRLAENPEVRVLLLEEGPHDRSLFIRANGAYFRTHGTKRTFLFATEPEPAAGGRRFPLMQGRTLGGGTSVNSMCYVRGQAADYDEWSAMGCTGWSYEDVLPYFRKSESNSRLADRYHGVDGPMHVSDGAHRHILSDAFVRGAQEVSVLDRNETIAFNHDFNGEQQEGVGYYQIMSSRGVRSSTSSSFLATALRRGNIVVRADTQVKRVVFEGRRAVGVELAGSGENGRILKAGREVILSGGTFMTPKILMLSGVGPGSHLQEYGIPVVHNSPQVGLNYQDHFLVPVDVKLSSPIGLIGQDKGHRAVINGLQWLMFGTGPLASNVVEAGGFFDLDGDGRPDIQLNALAASSGTWGDRPPRDHRFSLAPLCLTCNSRGKVSLRSTDPSQTPRVQGNVLHDIEVENLTNGIFLSRLIISAPSLARFMAGEVFPGPDVGPSRDEVRKYVKEQTKTALHPTSTCAMGSHADSVVDLELRVRGVDGLRIVDGSVMPKVVRGNTTAAIIMIAE